MFHMEAGLFFAQIEFVLFYQRQGNMGRISRGNVFPTGKFIV